MDEQVGKIIGKVDELGLRENTLIIFLSDHGHSVETRNNLWIKDATDRCGGGNAGPYRGYKTTLWEGGIRVPCIVSMPGTISENETRNQIASSLDWLPTIAHYTGVNLPARELDGKNIAAVIASAKAKTPHDVLHREFRGQWVVREGKWKLVGNGPSTRTSTGDTLPASELFLSDMSKDVTETVNLADKYPDVVRRLKRLHDAWAGRMGIVEGKTKRKRAGRTAS